MIDRMILLLEPEGCIHLTTKELVGLSRYQDNVLQNLLMARFNLDPTVDVQVTHRRDVGTFITWRSQPVDGTDAGSDSQ